MKLLVTGSAGFLGSHVCEHFHALGWDVIAYDNMSKFETSRIQFGNQERIRNYNKEFLESINIPIVVADIRNKQCLSQHAKGCDYVINCAAQPTMTLSEEDPVLDFETNAEGTLNLLEVCRKYKIPFATCSTIHVYGTGINDSLVEGATRYLRTKLITEDDPILTGHLTPLHASKFAAETYVRTYIDTYKVRATAFRLTGIYGPRQFGSEDHGWVSLMAIKTMLGLPIQLIGTGKQVRDILYVDDVVMAFEFWYRKECPAGIYNVCGGSSNAVSVLKVIREFAEIFGVEQAITNGGVRPGDLLWFIGDCTKAKNAFSWGPTILPNEGLRKFSEWLKQNRDVFLS